VRSIDEVALSNDLNFECSALEIECVPFQSNSFAVHPIQHASIKENSTQNHTIHHHKGVNVFFVPVDKTDESSVVVEPVNKTTEGHPDPSHIHEFDWPWNAEIYSNGDHVANGILLDKSWILVEKDSLGSAEEPLHESFVVAVLGNPKTNLKIQSPYEQISRVDCLQKINDSNALLLHLQTPVDFNRHVLPSFLPIVYKRFQLCRDKGSSIFFVSETKPSPTQDVWRLLWIQRIPQKR
jgi:hypothetical protein